VGLAARAACRRGGGDSDAVCGGVLPPARRAPRHDPTRLNQSGRMACPGMTSAAWSPPLSAATAPSRWHPRRRGCGFPAGVASPRSAGPACRFAAPLATAATGRHGSGGGCGAEVKARRSVTSRPKMSLYRDAIAEQVQAWPSPACQAATQSAARCRPGPSRPICVSWP